MAQLAERDRELEIGQEREAATAAILKVIASSTSDLQPVFDAIAESARRLLGGFTGAVQLYEGEWMQLAALTPLEPLADAAARAAYPMRLPPADSPLAAQMREQGFRVISDMLAEENRPFSGSARARGFRSALIVQMRIDADPIGAIVVTRKEPGDFAPRQIALIQTLADQAVIAIQNARQFNETRRALERQTATSDILKVIAGSPSDTAPVFEAIAHSANRLLGGLSTAVWRFVGEVGHLAAFTPTNPEADAALRALSPVPVRDLSVFVLLKSGEIAQLADTEKGPAQLRDLARLRGYRAMLFVPLVQHGEAIGFVSVTRREPGVFEPDDVTLLKTFADQAVIAIHNARLFNDTKEALDQLQASADVLGAIGRSVSDAAPVFEEILSACQRLFGSHEMGVYTVDANEMVRVAAWRGETRAEVKTDVTALAQSITGRIIAERRTHHIPNLIEDPNLSPLVRERAERLGSASLLYAPMLREERGLGSILVVRSPPKPFTARETDMLRTFADQAAIAIENARLFNETKEALERQTATAEILKVIASSPADAQPVFQAIADSAKRLLGGHSVMVARYVGGMSHLAAITPISPEADATLRATYPRPLSGNALYDAVKHGRPFIVADVEESDPQNLREQARARGWRSLIALPLLSQGAAIGTIAVTRAVPGVLLDDDIELLRTFADQAVIAIENARLLNDIKEALQQQTATADVLKVISRSAFGLKTVLQALVDSAVRLCASDGVIYLRHGDEFRAEAVYGAESPGYDSKQRSPRRAGRDSVIGRVALSGDVEQIPDNLADPDWKVADSQRMTMRSLLGVPLLRDGVVEGVFLLGRWEPGLFTDRMVELVRTFADQAVIAIENVRLFEQVEARTRELAASLDDLRKTQDRLVQTEKLASLGQLTAGIAHEIKNPLNFVNNFSALTSELTDELLEVLAPAPLDKTTREEIDQLAHMIKDNLKKVVSHGQRADSIVKNMLLHSRTGASEHRLTDINAILEESLNLAYHGARAEKPDFNITLKRDLDPTAGVADVFPQEISRAFLNLISNGFYAATKRREIEGGDFAPSLSVRTRNHGGTIEIRIRDNGTGIPDEAKEKIFHPFFTTKPAGEGTGLGLSMTHDIIVKQHGGTIEVSSSPGEFTEFRLSIPRGGAKGG